MRVHRPGLGLLLALPGVAQDRALNPTLHVAFVGDLESPRGADFVRFLRAQFVRVDAVEAATCTPRRLRTADVVLLDQTLVGWAPERADAEVARHVPLGDIARWDRPTVLLGRAGLQLARVWHLPGIHGAECRAPIAYGMREHPVFHGPHPIDTQATVGVEVGGVDDHDASGWCTATSDLLGPEIEVICGGISGVQPTHATIWRQGNLLHFGVAPRPSAHDATGRQLLLNAIAYIARFQNDRPIVRTRPSTAEATTLPSDDDARALGVDVGAPAALAKLAERLRGPDADRARAVLLRLLPDGPDANTSPNNWRNWLDGHEAALCFDPHSRVYRLDSLAYWRQERSADLRGPRRADGDAVRDPAAAALAAKIAAAHGGARALDDLQAFAFRIGEVRCLWDRTTGVFRLENSGTIPAGNRGTSWRTVIFDTVADQDILKGGGPAPRPLVSGRSSFRELTERVFLPLLVLEPGTSLRLLPDDDQGRAQLEVRLGRRSLDPKQVYVLHVDRGTGALRTLDVMPQAGSRRGPTRWHVETMLTVGPLTLPGTMVREGPREQRVEYGETQWNPKVPEGTERSPDFVLGAK